MKFTSIKQLFIVQFKFKNNMFLIFVNTGRYPLPFKKRDADLKIRTCTPPKVITLMMTGYDSRFRNASNLHILVLEVGTNNQTYVDLSSADYVHFCGTNSYRSYYMCTTVHKTVNGFYTVDYFLSNCFCLSTRALTSVKKK